MDLSSTYKDRPVLIWVAIGIVVAVAVWLVIQGYMISTSDIDASSLTEITDEMVNAAKTVLMGIYVLLGILTLAIAYLLYRGARGGRTVLVFITAISIVFNAYGMVMGTYLSIIELVCAIACLFIMYQPQVRAYFNA